MFVCLYSRIYVPLVSGLYKLLLVNVDVRNPMVNLVRIQSADTSFSQKYKATEKVFLLHDRFDRYLSGKVQECFKT